MERVGELLNEFFEFVCVIAFMGAIALWSAWTTGVL